MSGFNLPRFAKTGGKKLDGGPGLDSPGTKSPSFFRTLKAKLKNVGSRSFDEDDDTPDRSTFGSSGGKKGGARSVHAFAWANHGATQAGHNSSLPECAAEGDLEGVKRLLNLGEDVDSIDEQGNTALHFSAENGFEEIAALLLSRRADANAANEDGDTPLHKATISNYINILALLVAGQADVNAQSGREPGQRTNNEEIIQLLKAHKLEQSSQRSSPDRRSSHPSPKKTPSAADRATQCANDEWDLADQRELYEVQWTMFVSNKDPGRRITYGDVPWPGHSSSSADILAVVLYGTSTAEEKKRRLRSELLRWHPDKFQALFGRNLRAGDAERILAKVKEISQVINVASK